MSAAGRIPCAADAIPGACQMSFSGVQCAGQPAGTWHGACVHEHVTTDILICADHEDRMKSPWTCTPCQESADPHKCLVTPVSVNTAEQDAGHG